MFINNTTLIENISNEFDRNKEEVNNFFIFLVYKDRVFYIDLFLFFSIISYLIILILIIRELTIGELTLFINEVKFCIR